MAGGGHTGRIEYNVEHELYVGPTSSTEFNTYRPALFPVACWHIYDLRFEFDSSFVLPDSQDEMAQLKQLCAEHPESPLSVFGHADPVGDESYNKTLSGRRAKAVHDLIVRDVAGWETLYSQPFGGDSWSAKGWSKMLAALGLPSNHPNNKANRATVFQQYMDFLCGGFKLTNDRFLARGAGTDGKGDYQGCSEFNPLRLFSKDEDAGYQKSSDKTKRNEENAPNRRVVVYLFRKDAIVAAGKWPCPTWKEGVTGCKKRFWSDSTARLTLGPERREYEKTKDTFACRFYDRIAGASPCETLTAPTPIIKIWNIQWIPAEGFCGDKVKFTAETSISHTNPVKFKMTPVGGNTSKAELTFEATQANGNFNHEIEIKNFGFDSGASFVEKIEITAVPEDGSIIVEGVPGKLTVKAALNAAEQTYSKLRNNEWGATKNFVNYSEFQQKIEKFRNKVFAELKYIKAWGGYWADCSADGATGTVTDGPPWAGYRWARPDPANPMFPGDFWNGAAWVPLTKPYTGNYSAIGFKKSGSDFVPVDGTPGKWPVAFTDYNPEDNVYKNKRKQWADVTHAMWSDQYQLLREDCKSDAGVRCCRYDLEAAIKFTPTDTWVQHKTITISPSGMRANAAHWFYGDTRPWVGAHETGHHFDQPDEYSGGAIDTALNVPGHITAGINTAGDSLMFDGGKARKWHFDAFEIMLGRLVKTAYGRTYTYKTVDKI